MAYYGIYSRYGNDTYHADSGLRTGTLIRFETKTERDNWLKDCDWQESHKRMAINRRGAAYHFKNAFARGCTADLNPGSWEQIEIDDRAGNVPESARQWID